MSGGCQDFDIAKFKVRATCKGPLFESVVTSDLDF